MPAVPARRARCRRADRTRSRRRGTPAARRFRLNGRDQFAVVGAEHGAEAPAPRLVADHRSGQREEVRRRRPLLARIGDARRLAIGALHQPDAAAASAMSASRSLGGAIEIGLQADADVRELGPGTAIELAASRRCRRAAPCRSRCSCACAARARRRASRRCAKQRSGSISRPNWVSLTEIWQSSVVFAMRVQHVEVVSDDRVGFGQLGDVLAELGEHRRDAARCAATRRPPARPRRRSPGMKRLTAFFTNPRRGACRRSQRLSEPASSTLRITLIGVLRAGARPECATTLLSDRSRPGARRRPPCSRRSRETPTAASWSRYRRPRRSPASAPRRAAATSRDTPR